MKFVTYRSSVLKWALCIAGVGMLTACENPFNEKSAPTPSLSFSTDSLVWPQALEIGQRYSVFLRETPYIDGCTSYSPEDTGITLRWQPVSAESFKGSGTYLQIHPSLSLRGKDSIRIIANCPSTKDTLVFPLNLVWPGGAHIDSDTILDTIPFRAVDPTKWRSPLWAGVEYYLLLRPQSFEKFKYPDWPNSSCINISPADTGIKLVFDSLGHGKGTYLKIRRSLSDLGRRDTIRISVNCPPMVGSISIPVPQFVAANGYAPIESSYVLKYERIYYYYPLTDTVTLTPISNSAGIYRFEKLEEGSKQVGGGSGPFQVRDTFDLKREGNKILVRTGLEWSLPTTADMPFFVMDSIHQEGTEPGLVEGAEAGSYPLGSIYLRGPDPTRSNAGKAIYTMGIGLTSLFPPMTCHSRCTVEYNATRLILISRTPKAMPKR